MQYAAETTATTPSRSIMMPNRAIADDQTKQQRAEDLL